MKIRKIAFLLLCGLLFGFAIQIPNIQASSLAVAKHTTLSSGALATDVTYESFTGTTTTDAGTTSNQRISYVKKDSSSVVEVVAWSKLGNTSIIGTNMIELAQDFESKNPGYTVIAGINGDYYDPSTKTPVNALVQNGDVVKYSNFSLPRYFSIGIEQFGTSFISNKVNELEQDYVITFYDKDSDLVLLEVPLQGFNQLPGINQTSVYYQAMTSYEFTGIAKFDVGLSTRMNYGTLLLKGSVLGSVLQTTTNVQRATIVTQNETVNSILSNNPNIRIQKNLKGVYNAVENIIGVGSQVLKDGEILSFTEIGDQSVSFASARAPRSSIGFGANGEVILATIDGRQTNMAGANLREEAMVMQSLGAVNAFNFDGGGSTQLIIRENGVLRYLNSPSELYRKNANGILFVVPDVSVALDIQDVYFDAVHAGLNLYPQTGIEILDTKVYINNKETSFSEGNNIFSLDNNLIHYINVEVTYRKNGVTTSRVFVSRRINVINYGVEIVVPPKVKPSNFELTFIKREDILGFEVIISLDDPDDTLHMLLLVIDGRKEVALKYSRGYVVEFANVLETTAYSFLIEYRYRLEGITPVIEQTTEPIEYTFVLEEEVIDIPEPTVDEPQKGCKNPLVGFWIFSVLVGFGFIYKRRGM